MSGKKLKKLNREEIKPVKLLIRHRDSGLVEAQGFSIEELKRAGISIAEAKVLGIPIDEDRKYYIRENIEKLKRLVGRMGVRG